MTGSASEKFPGLVEMVAKSEIPNTPETAQIALTGAGDEDNIITVENTLTDKNSHDVHLHVGQKVEVTVGAQANAVQAADEWPGIEREKDDKEG
jgi:hypothetical protein